MGNTLIVAFNSVLLLLWAAAATQLPVPYAVPLGCGKTSKSLPSPQGLQQRTPCGPGALPTQPLKKKPGKMLGGGIDLMLNSSYHPSNSFQCSISPAKLSSITRTLNTKHWPSNTSYQCCNHGSHYFLEELKYEWPPQCLFCNIEGYKSISQDPKSTFLQHQ